MLYANQPGGLLFCENESNNEKLFSIPGKKDGYYKDGINDYVVDGNQDAVSSEKRGTKAAAHFQLEIGAGQTSVIKLRLTKNQNEGKGKFFGKDFDKIFADRLSEADEFYKSVTPPSVNKDKANVMRQAIAGMLLSKQYFFFDGNSWLNGRSCISHRRSSVKRPEPRVATPEQCRYYFHARWLGISLVCRMGPGFSLYLFCGYRPGFFQRSIVHAYSGVVYASKWPVSGL